MCGRFAADFVAEDLANWYHAQDEAGLPAPSWNVKPTQTVASVVQDSDGVRHVAPAYWSLIPPWAREKKLKYPTFNARVETALEKRTYAKAARFERCIIPASGYYEWTKSKKPYYFSMPQTPIISIGGLFSWWRASDDEPWLLTVTILTRDATEQAATVHDRMPLLIGDSLRDDWLDRSVDGADIIPHAQHGGAAVSERLTMWPVAQLQGDSPKLVEPISKE